MELSEIINLVLGGGLVATIAAIITLKSTVRKAKAEAEKAEVEAETVRIDNTEKATRVLIENIVNPLKEELNETRKDLNATKREMARLRKAIDDANSCRYSDDCPVLHRMRIEQKKREPGDSQEANRLDVDSTVSVVETWRTPVKVPMSAVSLTLSMDSLRLLPSGAGYTARKGQANVKVTRRAPTEKEPEQLVIEAGCDSLELVCAGYSKTISTLKRQLKEARKSNSELREETKESSGNTFLMRLKYFCAGLLSGIIGIVFTFIKLRK